MPAPGSCAAEKLSRSLAEEEVGLLRALELRSPPGHELGSLLLGEQASLEQRRCFAIVAGKLDRRLESPPSLRAPTIARPCRHDPVPVDHPRLASVLRVAEGRRTVTRP